MSEGPGEVRAIRAQVRAWRRGRADARLVDVLSEVYVGVFSAAVLGSMAANVVVGVARISDTLCTSEGCRSGRTVLPWVIGAGAVLVLASLARLFGPVFAAPASVSWLVTAPLPRAALLRPRLLLTYAVAATVAALVTLAGFTLAGYPAGVLAGLVAAAALAGVLVVAAAAATQATGSRAVGAGRWVLGVAVWAALAAQAGGLVPGLDAPRHVPAWWWVADAGLAVLATGAAVLAVRRLGRLHVRDLSPGGEMAPGLSGALATLDLALVYDVVLAHRWRRRGAVVPRRGGPTGPAAVAWADVVRLRRRPAPLVMVAGAAVLPWSAAAAGAGRVTVLVAVIAGFVAGLPLLGALRVITRTPSIERSLPFAPHVTRAMSGAVPLVLLLGYGLCSTPALHHALDAPWSTCALIGFAAGAGAATAAARWVTGRPPDYAKPLVSTPAGGVPTNLYGSVLRGFDVALLVSTPILLLPTPTGAVVSVALSGGVAAYLLNRV